MKKFIVGCIVFFVFACAPLALDPSMGAVAAGDYTLAASVCSAAPGRGVDICRVKAGAPIDGTWDIIVPSARSIKGGEINVQYRDVTKSYGITGTVVKIPLQDLFGHPNWFASDSGTGVAFAKIIYNSSTGEDVINARGFVFFVVTDESYDPLPIDSAYATFPTTCKIAYSTAGRSAVSCK